MKSWEDYSAKVANERKADLDDSDVIEMLKEDGESSGINWRSLRKMRQLSLMPVCPRPFLIRLLGRDLDADPLQIYNLEAYLPGFLRDYFHDQLSNLRIWLIENGILADNPSKKGESRLVKAAREAFQSAESEVNSKSSALAEQQKDLEKDYGADGIFRFLKGKCVSTDSGEYEYEMCWMDKTTQKSKKGHGNTNMGNFVEIHHRDRRRRRASRRQGPRKGPETRPEVRQRPRMLEWTQ